MATLVEGVQYGLSSHGDFYENKLVVFVKLTDSAYREIEEQNKNQRNNQASTIQFLGNEGRICFASSDSNRGQIGFSFSLSSNDDEGPQSSFHCVRQSGPKSLESIGIPKCNIRIQAKEDVYEATRHRMAVAEQNQKKNCTREIKPSGPGISRRVKVKSNSDRGPPVLPSKKECDPLKNFNSVHNMPINGFSHNISPINNNNNVKPHININSVKNRIPKPNNNNSDVSRRPIRERIIHLLALKPFKKPELVDRIMKEGCKEKDKGAIMTTLKSVSFMRDNTYHLLRYLWNDVQDEWPFYTEQEKQTLKRRKPENLTPPGSSDGGSSGSGHSPNILSSSPPQNISRTSDKRPAAYTDGTDGFPPKKQRISHYKKPPRPDDSGGRNDIHSREGKIDCSDSPEVSSVPELRQDNNKAWNGFRTDQRDSWNNSRTDHNTWNGSKTEDSSLCNGVKDADHKMWNGAKEECTAEGSPVGSESSDIPAYMSAYTTITNSEQRAQYKADFNADYNEYKELHAAVEKVSKRFAELEERLRQETEGSPAYQNIKSQILREYRERKKDKEHERATRRFTYLHEKLSHIKRLVLEYDTAQHY